MPYPPLLYPPRTNMNTPPTLAVNPSPTRIPPPTFSVMKIFFYCSHGWHSYGEGRSHSVEKNRNNAPSTFLRPGSWTVFPPPPLTPIHSATPDPSAFGTTTLHAETRRVDQSTRNAHLVRLRFGSAPDGKFFFFPWGVATTSHVPRRLPQSM